jgi:hypothetical protein
MHQPCGSVTVNDTPTKSKLYRFCEKKIDQWIRTKVGPATGEPTGLEFRVSFTEEAGTRKISCVTEIQLGGKRFRGCDLAGDTQMAFMHAMKRLQPN